MQTASVDAFINADMAFAGTPDTVFGQVRELGDHLGGIGHLLMMGQGGHTSAGDMVANLTLISGEGLSRSQEWSATARHVRRDSQSACAWSNLQFEHALARLAGTPMSVQHRHVRYA